MIYFAKCAKPVTRNLNRAAHAAVSETEFSLHAVQAFHTYCAPVGSSVLFSELMHFSSFCVSRDQGIFFCNLRKGKS